MSHIKLSQPDGPYSVEIDAGVMAGRRLCRDCMRIANTTEVRRVPKPRGSST